LPRPKTHAIEQLLDPIKRVDPDTALILKDTAVLTPYEVDIRYPGDQPEPNLEETRQAVELARKVRHAVINRLQEDL
jgi:HEPN domain-containing protein